MGLEKLKKMLVHPAEVEIKNALPYVKSKAGFFVYKDDDVYWNVQILNIPGWVSHITKEIVELNGKKALKVEIEAVSIQWDKYYETDLFLLSQGKTAKVKLSFNTQSKPI